MSPPFLQRTKNTLIYLSVRCLVSTLGVLPFPLLGLQGKILGRAGYILAGKERRKTLENLLVAFGDSLPKQDLRRIAIGSWMNLGRNALEMIGWSRWPQERVARQVARVQGWEIMEAALKRGKGVFAVTAHLGHWELLAATMGSRTPIAVVAKPLYDPRLDRMITDFRARWGGPVIPRGGALKGILKALSENRVIGVLMDQDTGDDGVFVPFFGREAWTQSGPARIAKKTGAALLPVFLVRGRDGRFEMHIEPEVEIPDTGDLDADVKETVRRYTEVIEGYVRAYPEQWVWMHDRWRTQKPAAGGWRAVVDGR